MPDCDFECLHTRLKWHKPCILGYSQYLATMVKTEIWKRVSCRVCCRYSASPITNTAADLQMLGDLLSFSLDILQEPKSQHEAQTRHCRTINKSAANGRVLLILLPLVRATNDLFLFSALAYNSAAGIQHLAEAQMQQIRDRNWRQKWQIFSPTNTILNINDKAVWRPQS